MKSKADACQAVVDASSISAKTLADAIEIISQAGASPARARAATYKMAFLVDGYMSEGQFRRPAKDDHRRLQAMARQLVSFREKLHQLDPEVRVALNHQLGVDERHGESWRRLTTSAGSLASRISKFDRDLVGQKRPRTDARQLVRAVASVWCKATDAWPSTATVSAGSGTRATSPLHKLIRDLAKESGARLPPKERKERMDAISLDCFIRGIRAAKAKARKTGQGPA